MLLILTGLPSTFWGHKNRWSLSFLHQFRPPTDLITQDILFPHWILYPLACLLRTHPQIRYPCCSEPAFQVPPRPLRPCLFHRRCCRWSHCNFLLESCPVWYRRVGRFCFRTMGTMFPQWRSHQAYRIEVDSFHWFVPLIDAFLTPC